MATQTNSATDQDEGSESMWQAAMVGKDAFPYQIKDFSGTVKDVDMKNRTVSGYFSVFDVKDSDDDIIKPGAYTKTIQENGPSGKDRVMHLLQHNPTKPLGKPHELKEDDKGLFFRTRIVDTSFGTDTLKLYRDEVFKEHSIGFKIVDSHRDEEQDADVLTELKLFEGSTVTWGANEEALGGMKSDNDQTILERYKELQKAYYRGDYRDETFRLIQKQMIFLEQRITKALNQKPQASTPSEPQSSTSVSERIDAKFDEIDAILN